MTGIAKITKENADSSVQIKELNAYEIVELLARLQDAERELAEFTTREPFAEIVRLKEELAQANEQLAAAELDTAIIFLRRMAQEEKQMHYKNGREAKNGDKVVLFPSYGSPIVGILYEGKAGNDFCNCNIAPIATGDA